MEDCDIYNVKGLAIVKYKGRRLCQARENNTMKQREISFI